MAGVALVALGGPRPSERTELDTGTGWAQSLFGIECGGQRDRVALRGTEWHWEQLWGFWGEFWGRGCLWGGHRVFIGQDKAQGVCLWGGHSHHTPLPSALLSLPV